MIKFISEILNSKEELEKLQYSLDMAENKCESLKFLIDGLENELNGEYEFAITNYQRANEIHHTAKADVHILICLKCLGNITEAKEMLQAIRQKDAFHESQRVGKLLEDGYFGEPDYYEARRWYISAAWPSPNNENVINARNNLKRIMVEHAFDDYCVKCGKHLINELIYFNNSSLESEHIYCKDCLIVSPFVYILNPRNGEVKRLTVNYG